MKKTIIVVLAATVGLGIGAYFYFTRNKQTAITWKTAKVEKGDITTLVTATGSLAAVTTVLVGTQVSGTISKLFVDFNTIVKKGDIIAILDTTALVSARVDASASADKARTQSNQYKSEYDRAKILFDQRVNTRVEYDLALTNYRMGQSNLVSAMALLSRAKINLQYATIKAPISGTIISRNVDVGQTVISSFNTPTLFTIANDLTKMEVQANIDEADIGQIKIGQSANFTVDAYPNEVFIGKVEQIRLQSVVLANVVSYVVIISVPNPDLKLMPGLTANINVSVQERKDVWKVPISALHFTPPAGYGNSPPKDSLKKMPLTDQKSNPQTGMKVVARDDVGVLWLLEEETLRPERVFTGISDGTFIEVQGALKTGDLVVTGISHGEAATPAAQNPFMPKMTTRPRAGRP